MDSSDECTLSILCFHAGTQSSQLELSLADLEQKALFLPRSALSKNLEEIGQGGFIQLLTPNNRLLHSS